MANEFTLGYGYGQRTFRLPESVQHVDVITAAEAAPAEDPIRAVQVALDNPVGPVELADFEGAESAAVAINDKTRPVPHIHLLPPLLARLEALGLPPEAIRLIIANGTHAPMTPDEFSRILPPEVLDRYPVISHDCNDDDSLVFRGQTSRGTPVWMNREYMAADVRLVVGNMEPHMFVGFSGGVKSAAIGLAGYETILHNHSMLVDPNARMNIYEENPIRMDVEEIGRLADIHFALNAILNGHKQIVHALAGTPQDVMRAGIPLVRSLAETPISRQYDLVIASSGGAPKDINLYQAQKALVPASMLARTGGTVILVASCMEGVGSAVLESWMAERTSVQDVLETFAQEEFRIGKHKAFLLARDAARVNVILVSDMAPEKVRQMQLTPASDLQQAVDAALAGLPPDAAVAVAPVANAIVPQVRT